MMSRRAVGAVSAALLLLLAVSTTGCVPEPAPSPTPTGFATEEEAFAAAEETYRAYVDALNQVDLSDPDTFEPVFAWTTGEANANERETLSQMHADGWVKGGMSEFVAYRGTSVTTGSNEVSGIVCVDVSTVTVTDSSGASKVSPDRPDQYALDVLMTPTDASPTGLQIAASNAIRDGSCAL